MQRPALMVLSSAVGRTRLTQQKREHRSWDQYWERMGPPAETVVTVPAARPGAPPAAADCPLFRSGPAAVYPVFRVVPALTTRGGPPARVGTDVLLITQLPPVHRGFGMSEL